MSNTLANQSRPRYTPQPCTPKDDADKLQNESDKEELGWLPILSCNADFPPELFEVAMVQLIEHPEYNSTLILRSEIISDTVFPMSEGLSRVEGVPALVGYQATRNIHRKLLPRRPGRDPSIEQNCTFYVQCEERTTVDRGEGASNLDRDVDGLERHASCVVLSPILKPGEPMPFYHPTVSRLAFRYITTNTQDQTSPPQLRIETIPLPSTPTKPPPTDPSSRLYRTSLALLETVHRYGYGALTNYRKRVHHDCIIPREEYQDLYLVMREKYKYLVSEWKETTDPAKHVFEDVGIATFLMLLWKQGVFVGDDRGDAGPENRHHMTTRDKEDILSWARPPGGFLDLGCGNGLLTHILVSEGYDGYGVDLRARNSWSYYPETTQERLRVHAIDPLNLDIAKNDTQQSYLPPGVFIIANHADELTPWTPLLATLCNASGYLSIPCCAWAFDSRFERGVASNNGPVPSVIQIGDKSNEMLGLGAEAGGTTSSYLLYRIWLANLGLYCGWENEYDTLRIPSTRNWSIIGRKRKGGDYAKECVEEIVQWVRERGIFKTRRPEGKAGDH